jgi:putative ABC transport system permease protein
MQVISILGATALVFAGLSLLDNVKVLTDYANSSIETISYIVIVCAGVLSILVTYNLTNMNVENREREIATLKVLGYKRGEVAMYIYREVFIISTIGILLGIPTGYLIDGVLFDYIEFGSIEHVRYISIFYTLLLSYSFIILSDILLYRKIHQIDMNGALKSLE